MGFEPARQRYIASQKPNRLPTELSGRPGMVQHAYNCGITIFTLTPLPFLTSLPLMPFDVDVIIFYCIVSMTLDKGNTPNLVKK